MRRGPFFVKLLRIALACTTLWIIDAFVGQDALSQQPNYSESEVVNFIADKFQTTTRRGNTTGDILDFFSFVKGLATFEFHTTNHDPWTVTMQFRDFGSATAVDAQNGAWPKLLLRCGGGVNCINSTHPSEKGKTVIVVLFNDFEQAQKVAKAFDYLGSMYHQAKKDLF